MVGLYLLDASFHLSLLRCGTPTGCRKIIKHPSNPGCTHPGLPICRPYRAVGLLKRSTFLKWRRIEAFACIFSRILAILHGYILPSPVPIRHRPTGQRRATRPPKPWRRRAYLTLLHHSLFLVLYSLFQKSSSIRSRSRSSFSTGYCSARMRNCSLDERGRSPGSTGSSDSTRLMVN